METAKRIILWLTLAFACLLPASALTPTTPENCIWEIFNIGYDAPIAEAIPTYDSPVQLTSAYDNAPNHRVGDERRSDLGTCTLFGPNAEFKAAEGGTQTLFHYTTEAGMNGIKDSEQLLPSLKAVNPNDARYGNGQYLTDILPGTRTGPQLSYDFLRVPWQGSKFTHYVEIDVSGLKVVPGRPGVFVVPNEGPLDLTGRIISSGKN